MAYSEGSAIRKLGNQVVIMLIFNHGANQRKLEMTGQGKLAVRPMIPLEASRLSYLKPKRLAEDWSLGTSVTASQAP